jgi:DNA-binding transcriptional MerR regulator
MKPKEKITDKARYPHEIAEFCGISTATLRNWVQKSPYANLLKRGRNYYTPKEVELLLRHFDYDIL